ncbi:MAG: alpha/beta hydrolase [Hyphomicrobiales bacterium]
MPGATFGPSLRAGLVAILTALFAAVLLAGCASGPGPEVLDPVGAPAAGARSVRLFVATTRTPEAPAGHRFTRGRSAEPAFAEYTVSVPPDHTAGQIEWPKGRPAAATTFAVLGHRALAPATFHGDIAADAAGHGARKVALFVHGYNTSFQQALFRLAQMVADSNIDGTPILFAWPSEAAVAGYVADRDAAALSRDALANLLVRLAADRRVGEITVMAHSMGGWLTVEVLRQLRLSGHGAVLSRLNVVLAAPDIDIDLFRAQMQVIGPFPRPVVVLVSPDDRALLVSRRIGGDRPRLGALEIGDPRVEAGARAARIAIVDISEVEGPGSLNHDRFVGLAALYPRLAADERRGGGLFNKVGTFIFDTVDATLAAPAAAASPVGAAGE